VPLVLHVATAHAPASGHELSTLRERKKLRTRDALALAALRLSRARGFENVTIDEIAAEAAVSRRTFFRYFPSKEAAMFPNYRRRIGQFRSALSGGPPGEGPFATVARAFLVVAATLMRERHQLIQQQRVVDASPALCAHERMLDRELELVVASALERRGGRGSARDGRRSRVLAGATMGAVRATLREWFDSGARLDLVAMARETFAQLALANEPIAPEERTASPARAAKAKRLAKTSVKRRR
jgi:AcrR family transcriptional regulator